MGYFKTSLRSLTHKVNYGLAIFPVLKVNDSKGSVLLNALPNFLMLATPQLSAQPNGEQL